MYTIKNSICLSFFQNSVNIEKSSLDKIFFYGYIQTPGKNLPQEIFGKTLKAEKLRAIGKGRVTKTLTGFSFKFQPAVETWWYTRGGIPRR